jgi:hypothetical protein
MVRNRCGAGDAICVDDEHDAMRTIDTRRKNTAVFTLTKYAGDWKMPPIETLKPWAQTPFELLRHAEEHLRSGTDFDRRIAMVGFDNSIEVSVITYLSLNPIQRGNRAFAREAVANWNRNFHTKLEFLEAHAQDLGVPMEVERAWLVFYHELRNDLYHVGNGLVPAEEHLRGIRRGAIWAFSLLFECDGEALLDAYLSEAEAPASPPEPTKRTAVAMSDATTFLQAFLSVKQLADELLELRGKTADFSSLLAEARATSEMSGSQTDPVPAELVESLARAEQAKDLILRGDTPGGDTPPLDSLAHALDKFGLRLKSTLRSHQQEIALGALDATLAAGGQSPRRRGHADERLRHLRFAASLSRALHAAPSAQFVALRRVDRHAWVRDAVCPSVQRHARTRHAERTGRARERSRARTGTPNRVVRRRRDDCAATRCTARLICGRLRRDRLQPSFKSTRRRLPLPARHLYPVRLRAPWIDQAS